MIAAPLPGTDDERLGTRIEIEEGAEDARKINELRRIEGYLVHLQPGARIREIQRQPHMEAAREKLLPSKRIWSDAVLNIAYW